MVIAQYSNCKMMISGGIYLRNIFDSIFIIVTMGYCFCPDSSYDYYYWDATSIFSKRGIVK